MAKKTGWVLGIIFILAGVLGFMGTSFIGDMGTFHTNTLLSVVHVVTGLIFILVAAKSADSMGKTCKILGIIYIIIALLGFFVIGDDGMGAVLGFLHVNGATNILHIVLGIVALALGFKSGRGSSMPSMGGMPQ